MMRQVQVSVHGVKENAAFSLPCSSRSSAVRTLGVDSVKWCAQPSSQCSWTVTASCLQVWQGPVGLFDWDAAEDAADAVPQAWRRGSSRGLKGCEKWRVANEERCWLRRKPGMGRECGIKMPEWPHSFHNTVAKESTLWGPGCFRGS